MTIKALVRFFTICFAFLPVLAPAYGDIFLPIGMGNASRPRIAYNEVTGKLYIVDETQNRLLEYDTATHTITGQIPTAQRPATVEVMEDKQCLVVGCIGTNMVHFIDPVTLQTTETFLAKQTGIGGILRGASDSFYYLSGGATNQSCGAGSFSGNSISTSSVSVSGNIGDANFSYDRSRIVFSNNNTPGTASVVDPVTRTIVTNLSVSPHPTGPVVLNADASRVVVLYRAATRYLHFYTLSPGGATTTLGTLAGDVSALAWDPVRPDRLWRQRASNGPLDEVNATSRTVVRSLPVQGLQYLITSEDGDLLFGQTTSGTLIISPDGTLPAAPSVPPRADVFAFNPAVTRQTYTNPSSISVRNMVVDDARQRLYLTDLNTNTIRVFDLVTRTFLPSYDPGITTIRTAMLSPDGSRLYVGGNSTTTPYFAAIDPDTGTYTTSPSLVSGWRTPLVVPYADRLILGASDSFGGNSRWHSLNLADDTVTTLPDWIVSSITAFGGQVAAAPNGSTLYLAGTTSSGSGVSIDPRSITQNGTHSFTYGAGFSIKPLSTSYDGSFVLASGGPTRVFRRDMLSVADIFEQNFAPGVFTPTGRYTVIGVTDRFPVYQTRHWVRVMNRTMTPAVATLQTFAVNATGNQYYGINSTNLYVYTVADAAPVTTATAVAASVAVGETVALPWQCHDADGHTIVYMPFDIPTSGTTVVSGSNTTGSLAFTPEAGMEGTTWSVCVYAAEENGLANSLPMFFTLYVAPDADTTGPALDALANLDRRTMEVTYTEAVSLGALDPATYTLSGSGQGNLTPQPDAVHYVGGTTYRLIWNSGSQELGGDLTVAVNPAALADLVGNPFTTPDALTLLGAGLPVGLTAIEVE